MSLLDTLASSLGKSSPEGGGGPSSLIAAALEFVNNQPGGLNGLIDRFKEKGLGDIVTSWVSNGENQPIAPDALHSVLGSETVTNLAAKAVAVTGTITDGAWKLAVVDTASSNVYTASFTASSSMIDSMPNEAMGWPGARKARA